MMTTKMLRGTLKKLITAERVFSSMYLPLRVAMQGKNIPQQTSKSRKETVSTSSDLKNRTETKVQVAITKTREMSTSGRIPRLRAVEKRKLPTMIAIMKHAKTNPYGIFCLLPTASSREGDHMNTKVYIEASKRDCITPKRRTFLSARYNFALKSEILGGK